MKRQALPALSVAIAIALAACGDSAPAPASGAPAVATRTPASADADLVRAVLLSDGQPPVELRFRLPGRPAVGADIEMFLSLQVKQGLSAGKVRFSGRSGLALATEAAEFEFGVVEAGQSLPYAVKVHPAAEGVGELVVRVEGEAEAGPFGAEFSAPVIVAPAP